MRRATVVAVAVLLASLDTACSGPGPGSSSDPARLQVLSTAFDQAIVPAVAALGALSDDLAALGQHPSAGRVEQVTAPVLDVLVSTASRVDRLPDRALTGSHLDLVAAADEQVVTLLKMAAAPPAGDYPRWIANVGAASLTLDRAITAERDVLPPPGA